MKLLIKRLFKSLGISLHRYSPILDPDLQLVRGLTSNQITTVVDVGANEGQYGERLFGNGYTGRIISIEPLERAYGALKETASKYKDWIVAPRCAAGATDGEIVLNVSRNSTSSSILEIDSCHTSAAPDSSYFRSEIVPLRRVDSILKDIGLTGECTFLKIDTQGYEWEVLEGTKDIFSSVAGVQVEMSLVCLYEKQRLFDEIHSRLVSESFKLWGIEPVFGDADQGRLYQFDAIYFRDKVSE